MIKNENTFGRPRANPQSPVTHARPTSARGSVSNGVNSPVIPQQAMAKSQDVPEAIAQTRRDVDRLLSVMNDISRRMSSVETNLEELKAEQSSGAGRNSRYGSGFPREVEALTDNVSRLNSRVGDLDGLRLEMLMTKRRVTDLENGSTAASQSSQTVAAHAPLPSQTFVNQPAPVNGGMIGSFPTRPIQQATAGRREIPNSDPSAHQNEETPAVSSGVPMQLAGAQHVTSAPKVNHVRSSMSSERELYEATPEYRARKEHVNEASFRPLVPFGPASQPNQSVPSSATVSSTPDAFMSVQLQEGPTNQFTTVNRPVVTARRLNDPETVQISDPDDTDNAPDSQKPPSPRPIARGPRRGEKVRLPTPDWERPRWNGPNENFNHPYTDQQHQAHSPRRNINNNRVTGPDPKRRKTNAIDDGTGRVVFDSIPTSWTEGSAYSAQQPVSTFASNQTQPEFPSSVDPNGSFQPSPYPTNPHALEPPTRLEKDYPRPPKAKSPPPVKEKQDLRSVPRNRDAEGRLLRPDGKVDGRSVRYGTPNPRRRASGVPAATSKPTTPVTVAAVNTAPPLPPAPVPAPIAVNTPPVETPVAVNTPPIAVTTPVAVNTPPVAAAKVPTPPPVVSEPTPPPAQPPQPVAEPTPPPAKEPTPPAPTPPLAAPPAVATINAPSPAAPRSPQTAAPATRQSSRKMRRSGGGRERDEEGNLLGKSGKIDGRSLRYKRAKERADAERAERGEGEAEEGGDGEEEGEGGDEEGEGGGQLVGDWL